MEQFVEVAAASHRREVVVAGEGLQGPHSTSGSSIMANVKEEILGKYVFLDEDTDSVEEWPLNSKKTSGVTKPDAKPEISEIQDAPRTFSNEKSLDHHLSLPPSHKSQEKEKENKPSAPLTKGKTKQVNLDNLLEENDEDEDVIELEFENGIKKMDTHAMYCPICNTSITKVVLRKKRVKTEPSAASSPPQPEPVNLLGCLSCYSVFIPSGNCFNWIRIFGKGSENDSAEQPMDGNASAPSLTKDKNNMVTDQGDCFSLFRIFGDKSEKKNKQKPQLESYEAQGNGHNLIEQGEDQKQKLKGNLATEPHLAENSTQLLLDQKGSASRINGQSVYQNGVGVDGTNESVQMSMQQVDWKIDVENKSDGVKQESTLSAKQQSEIKEQQNGKAKVPEDEAGTSHGTRTSAIVERSRILPEPQDSKSLEILKSIVYGGLMESITSLSIVSSAAATDATTLNIVAIGFANLIGGLFFIGHNLGDLKTDTCEGAANKYQEQLGNKKNFLLHATFAVLSFLIFGLIPPATYGFTFDKTNDKDLTLVGVAAASLLCIILLAICKAYIHKSAKFYMYITTIMYYVLVAVTASGVAYAAGDLIKRFMENFGWFDTSSAFSLPDLPYTNLPKSYNWTSY